MKNKSNNPSHITKHLKKNPSTYSNGLCCVWKTYDTFSGWKWKRIKHLKKQKENITMTLTSVSRMRWDESFFFCVNVRCCSSLYVRYINARRKIFFLLFWNFSLFLDGFDSLKLRVALINWSCSSYIDRWWKVMFSHVLYSLDDWFYGSIQWYN